MNPVVQTLLTIVGSGAFFGFVQFMITRKDNKNDRTKALEKKIDEGLDKREQTGRERFEKHASDIEELRKIMTQLADNAKTQQEYSEAVGNVLMGLAQDKIVHLTKLYSERGAITLDELAVLESLYVPYHDGLHGNGKGKAGYERCQKLPVVSEAKARELDSQKGA